MTSAINPSVPATGAPIASAPIRSNFATAQSEISALQAAIAAGGGGGTITGVTAGTGLTGGGTSGTVALALVTPVSVANGGTGATSAPAALTSLGAAPIASPAFTGIPTTATSPPTADNTTKLATTAFVKAQAYVTGGPYLPLAGGTLTGGLTVGTAAAPSGGLLAGDINATRFLLNGSPLSTGGGGTPGGSNTYVQYNNAAAFGGSSGATFSGTALTSMTIALGSDAAGDMYYRGASGALTRLPAATAGWVLESGGVGLPPVWTSIATGGGTVGAGVAPQIAQYTGSTSVGGVTLGGDATIAVGGALTLNAIRAAVMPAFTGDVTSPAGSIVNTIAANAVTYPKMQAVTANRLLGSGLSGTAVAEITLGTNLSFTGTTLNAATGGGGLPSGGSVGQLIVNTASGAGGWNSGGVVIGTPSDGVLGAGALNLSAELQVNANAVGFVNATPPLNLLRLQQADGQTNQVLFNSFAAATQLVAAASSGTAQIPTALAIPTMLAIGARGYDGSAWSTQAVQIAFGTITSPWTTSDHSTRLTLSTTLVGSTSLTSQAVFGPGLTVGTPTAQPSPTTGDINAVRFFLNGQPFTGAADTVGGTITAAGTTQAGATALTSQFNVVTTVPVGSGVVLPTAVAGNHCIVRNSGANPLLVYPAGTAQINLLAASAAYGPIQPNLTAYFEAQSAAQWFSIP
jgi:hypothetical protein